MFSSMESNESWRCDLRAPVRLAGEPNMEVDISIGLVSRKNRPPCGSVLCEGPRRHRSCPVFNRAMPGDWGLHLETMRDFWSSVMLTCGRYKGAPAPGIFGSKGWSRRYSTAGWGSSATRAANCLMKRLPRHFVQRPLRIAESLKLSLFYRPDPPRPRSSS